MIKPWKRVRSGPSRSFRVFSIRADTTLSPRTGSKHNFYVIETRDWINVIPLTDDHQVVMIRQYHHGSREVTLEIPGGLVDPGETPKKAAARELLEETGYDAEQWSKIGRQSQSGSLQ
jgi:8-oxo-dGTP pyrophosphatase MutT (NUDIX family)